MPELNYANNALISIFTRPNDQDQRGEPDDLDGGTAIVEASAESTCWAVLFIENTKHPIQLHKFFNLPVPTFNPWDIAIEISQEYPDLSLSGLIFQMRYLDRFRHHPATPLILREIISNVKI